MKIRTMKRTMALVLAFVMAAGTSTLSLAADVGLSLGASGEILSFEPLGNDIANQIVPFGTYETELNLPVALEAVVRLSAYGSEPEVITTPEVTTPAALSAASANISGDNGRAYEVSEGIQPKADGELRDKLGYSILVN